MQKKSVRQPTKKTTVKTKKAQATAKVRQSNGKSSAKTVGARSPERPAKRLSVKKSAGPKSVAKRGGAKKVGVVAKKSRKATKPVIKLARKVDKPLASNTVGKADKKGAGKGSSGEIPKVTGKTVTVEQRVRPVIRPTALPDLIRRDAPPTLRRDAGRAERTGSLTAEQLRDIELSLLDEQSALRRSGASLNETLATERNSAEATGDIVDASGDMAAMESATLLASHTSRGLLEVDSALARLRSHPDKFGFCEVSGEPIPFGRLLVMPTARTLARCSKR